MKMSILTELSFLQLHYYFFQLRVATATDNVDKVKQVATEVNNIVHRENLYGGDLAKLTEIVNDIVDEIVIAPVEISTETVETVNEVRLQYNHCWIPLIPVLLDSDINLKY